MQKSFDFNQFGDLVATVGSREFGQTFYDLFGTLLNVEECTVFSFTDPSSPSSLLVEGKSNAEIKIARQLASDYVAGGYLSDPNLHRNIGVYITDSEHIFDLKYRKHYYEGPELTQELVVLANVKGTLYYSSFYRRNDERVFEAGDVDNMRAIASFMVKALHRHSELISRSPGAPESGFLHATGDMSAETRRRTLEYLREIMAIGPHKLTPREAEICASIIMGYSAEAISLNCSISVNTVATHRKRAYAKLGISSQNELFLRYFTTVRQFQAKLLI